LDKARAEYRRLMQADDLGGDTERRLLARWPDAATAEKMRDPEWRAALNAPLTPERIEEAERVAAAAVFAVKCPRCKAAPSARCHGRAKGHTCTARVRAAAAALTRLIGVKAARS
jgi:hypothetical protein